ncbi:LysR family transcriptional regulator, chromosome initiation inhibitor [Rhizobium sp. RU35A]|uniref:LysR family transcriptional regulator ArgP n=1 Tax=Rhizobium sp. RU35A TaxID=1907414 RepID=UPI000956CA98|nr:LysR family transcriptional regulator ArgP [Rhizobium sp. RU35A]SIQ88075.1 LysR family transcriptional regulator, chromosome initiation inhibitor [Rhizobium sp. RU35A]
MLDYLSLRAVAAVIRTGSFERAARQLHVTPSAVSQRVRQLEDRLGTVLVVRGTPCTATEKGAWLCRHMDQVAMLETDLLEKLPALDGGSVDTRPVTVRIATNADSLGTWFLEAVANFSRETGYLVDIAVDDQDHTAAWLERGEVLAAVTGMSRPVQGCRQSPLGILRYRATASPAFISRHFADGVTRERLARAPLLTFNRKDGLQRRWLAETMGIDTSPPTHWLPSTQGFVEACLSGMGWGMNPDLLTAAHLASGRLVELVAGTPVDVPLFWQVSRLAAAPLEALTRHVLSVARSRLVASG